LRQQRLAWRGWVKPEVAMQLLPGGLGEDPISLVIGLPGLLLTAVLVPLWLAELVLRLLLAPWRPCCDWRACSPTGWSSTATGDREARTRRRAAVS
jgi:hypothetical protein